MVVSIERSSFKELEPVISMAIRDGMRVKDVPGSVWFCARVDGEIAGFVSCYIRTKHGKAVFKSDYVREEFRRKGIYRLLFEKRLEYIKDFEEVHVIKASCTKMSLSCFLSYGFEKKASRSRKYTDVELHTLNH
ncbi:GNAT family N-acetyltransferase [Rossellomorea aquimaris]|uniref:GNAT family N-acetyltransferase n=1 Tax=Rossellomorea aquimaris TaxID=189382 RepID=UPI001CD7ED20|nr:GNAT family N-acetyltransferase [Rossellomorea aquimaris]MCA1057186.1 GNAT family N-acetyltransferase [Rossellomorea aquimaris]